MAVLSIQSSVALDPVGNGAAVFALQRAGHEVWAVHTVQLSNHTAYPDWGGGAFSPQHVRSVLAGIERRTGFEGLDAILTGYIGSPELAAIVAETVDRAKAVRPETLYFCDPVMGNRKRGLYVAEETADAVAGALVPRADILAPNAFELARLTGLPAATPEAALPAAGRLAERNGATAVVTSLAAAGGLGILALAGNTAWLAETPRLPLPGHGAGDLFAALLLGRLLSGDALDKALGHAVSVTFAMLEAGERGCAALVAAQDRIRRPALRFPARPFGPPKPESSPQTG